MASPFLASWEDTQKELVEPALEGTTTVLESVAKSKDTIKRVVLTSSFAGRHLISWCFHWLNCMITVQARYLHWCLHACFTA